MSSRSVSWIHISDAHFGGPDMAGEAPSVIAMLLQDLEQVAEQRRLRPDLLFFSGDLAFGELPNLPLEQQYLGAQQLLSRIQKLFAIPSTNVFVVPGNHDVNRTRVDKAQTSWVDSLLNAAEGTRSVDELWAKPERIDFVRFVERLENYAAFLQRAGLTHLLVDKRRLTYTHRRNIRGVDVAITGLNTAWSSCRDQEKGKLWLGQWQIKSNSQIADAADLAIAVGHHPPGWFNEYEDPAWYQHLSTHYDFYLHGHEHGDWVVDQEDHVRVAAGCLYEERLERTGYNFARIDFDERRAELFLRRYDTGGGGWIPRCLYRKTDDCGRWPLRFVPQLRKSRHSEHAAVPASDRKSPGGPTPIDVFQHFAVACAIPDGSRFIGRRDELRVGLSALRARGAAIAIFGLAGLGKTSLALELARIASGQDTKLCATRELATRVPPRGFSHQVVYYSCRQGCDVDLESTLASVLRDRIGMFHFGHLLTHPEIQAALARPEYREVQDLLEQFQQGTGRASALAVFRSLGSITYECLHAEPVVILDEFNVVEQKAGFATLLKELPQVKFVLVGTAVDVRLLVQDHASVPRQLAEGQIRLRPMSVDELTEVISNEEVQGSHRFSFSWEAKRFIARAARGVPFFVHFLARYSLDLAQRNSSAPPDGCPLKVELRHVHQTLQERLLDLVDLESEYAAAIACRWDRELTLKLLAEREEDTIPLMNLRDAAYRLNIKSIDTAIRNFVKTGVLLQEAEAMYQFRDTRLKVYARLREPVIEEARRRWAHHVAESARPSETTTDS